MKLNKHERCIIDTESWRKERPPKKGDVQWVEGRSAMELAKYITSNLPNVPAKIESAISGIVPCHACFDWDAERVTHLPGKGEGRNHDAVLWNDEVVVTIEAKVDEALGDLIGEELQTASVNKLQRISALLQYLFKEGFTDYKMLRYQLLTAAVGTILEAQGIKGCHTAVFLVVVFKTEKADRKKLLLNHQDIEAFLKATNAYEENSVYVIPNNTDIKLYFKEIVIEA